MSRKRLIPILAFGSALLFSCILGTLSFLPANADGEKYDIMTKTLVNGSRKCYTSGGLKSSFTLDSGNKISLDTIINTSNKTVVYLPTKFDNTVKSSKLTCRELFAGTSGLGGGLLDRYGLKVDSGSIEEFGYEITSGGSAKKCYSLEYKDSSGTPKKTNAVCFKVENGVITGTANTYNPDEVNPSSGVVYNYGYTNVDGGSNNPIGLRYKSNEVILVLNTNDVSPHEMSMPINFGKTTWSDFQDMVNTGKNTSLESMGSDMNGIEAYITKTYNREGKPYGYAFVSNNYAPKIEGSSQIGDKYQFIYGDANNAVNKFIDTITGERTFTNLTFSEWDKFNLYSSYLNEVVNSGDYGVTITADSGCSDNKPSNSSKYYIKNSSGKWCEINNVSGNDSIKDLKYNGVDSATGNIYLKPMSFTTILKELSDINYNDSSMRDADLNAAGSAPDSGTDEPDKDVSVACSKTGVLSWIMCPVIQLFYDGIMGMYSYIEGNFLEINSGYLLTNGNSRENAVYNGWKQFRDFANIVFVIMLVVVILSQVTGFGISNYGIKKALPKLIVVAILVNLSFLFCQLAVDVSNILGYTLRSMFRDIASKIGGTAFELPSMLESVVSFTLLGAGTAAILKFTQFWKTRVSILIPALAGIFIGVLFFFIVLGVRQAGVLILVVISPLAIICYALPNTKSLFDRWKKTLTALLLVFPICGALMGGGQLAATIIASSPGYTINEDVEEMKKDKGSVSVSTSVAVMASIPATHFADSVNVNDSKAGSGTSIIMGIIAMLVQVAPFFMVPTLVRNSMNALGNIGNKLTQTGARWGRGASNAISKTEAMQDFQRRMEASQNLGLAKKYESGKGLRNRVGTLLSGSDSKRARKLGSTLQSSAKRSRTRFANAYNKAQTEDEQIAIDNTELYTEGSEARETMKTRLRSEQMEKSIKAQRYNISNSDISDDVRGLRGALDQHREELKLNPDDEGIKAKVYAHLDQLTAQGDAGMTQVGQAIQAAIANDDLESAQIMSRYILKNYGKQYKDKQRGTFDMAGDLSRLKLDNATQVDNFKQKANLSSRARTRTVIDSDGNEVQETYAFYTSDYDKNGIDSLDAQRISDLNEDTLTRYHELAMTGQLNPQQMAALSRISARALANDANGTGHVQDKLRGKLDDLANIGIGQSNAFARAIQGSVDPEGSEASRREALSQAQGIARSMTGSSDGWQRLASQMTRMGSAGSAAVQGSLRSVMQDISDNTTNLSNATPMQSRLASDISAGDFTHLQGSDVREVSGINEGETEFSSDYYENNVAAFQHSAGTAPNPNLVDGRSDFGSMDLSQLQRMTRQAMHSWGTTINPDGTMSHGGFKNLTAFSNEFEYNNVAQGITKALQSDERFKDPANAQKVKELNKFLAAGGFKTVDPTKVKIPLPERPKGWGADGNFYNDAGQRIEPTPIQQEEYNQYVQDFVNKKRINEGNGFKDD